MKKIFSYLLVAFLMVFLVSCTDKKTFSNDVKVMYFVYNNALADNATINDELLDAGDKVTKPDDPKRFGYTFLGWYSDSKFTSKWDFDSDRVGEQSMTLYAKWDATSYTIVFDWNGGNPPASFNPDVDTVFLAGQNRTLPRPTRHGYSFISWYLYDEFGWTANATQTHRPGDNGYVSLGSIPLPSTDQLLIYAHWRAVTPSLTFIVNYNGTDGQEPAKPNSRSLAYNSIFKDPFVDEQGELIETSQYEFIGWNTNSAADENTQIGWLRDGDISTYIQNTTVYGIWKKK